ncbi:hypothetical protein K4K54_002873 [Colletotrichum sp. SAR 10_86]|nr:hypothetical protein KHU50_002070 [Colletotrichum sp. SAR 10_65]KAI8192052.1 hypothetical protein K4K51_008510 [Colletotrichum sp. SAR 10_75]KAI8236560.1 hypothetical protein K4K54_002873 [Colletotrichum sp. SAR 10_86]KAI8264802.1 hypothetical protein K4K53_000086 [Colletotrichum sp. SAR 10_77]
MRFTPAFVIAMASVASAGPIANEKRPACMAFCWEFCIVPTACGTCIAACMAVANPVKELDTSEFQAIVDAAKPGAVAAQ